MANQQKFCSVCGAKVEQKTDAMVYCPECKQEYYTSPNPAVEVALFNDRGEVLLSERAIEPNKGKWDLPGGFIDLKENAEVALPREIKEELDLNPDDYSELQFVRSYATRYPWGKVTYDLLVFVFIARIKNEKALRAQDDVASVKWIRPEDVDKAELSNPGLDEYIMECKTVLGL